LKAGNTVVSNVKLHYAPGLHRLKTEDHINWILWRTCSICFKANL